MSKMAVEAFSDASRRELSPLGIKVSIIQPGLVKTAFWDKVYGDSSRYEESIFKERFEKFIQLSVNDSMPKAVHYKNR
jgi:short-subunit dehydrogenase